MPVHDELGIRMKTYYEQIPKTKLMRRTPVAIRIDGKAFHTFTRGFQKPFDEVLIKSMQETMKYLCENIQGCKMGYCQSDEISLLITDYETINTAAWFDYQVQKMCSIAASMATLAFNRAFDEKVEQEYMSLEAEAMFPSYPDTGYIKEWDNIYKAHEKAFLKGAMFDARCFSIPKEEVCYQLARYLRDLHIETIEDFQHFESQEILEIVIRAVNGLGDAGVNYLFMLAGDPNRCKPDVHIHHCIRDACGHDISNEDCQTLFTDAVTILHTQHPNLTVRGLDGIIWRAYQIRAQRGNCYEKTQGELAQGTVLCVNWHKNNRDPLCENSDPLSV